MNCTPASADDWDVCMERSLTAVCVDIMVAVQKPTASVANRIRNSIARSEETPRYRRRPGADAERRRRNRPLAGGLSIHVHSAEPLPNLSVTLPTLGSPMTLGVSGSGVLMIYDMM